MTGSRGFTLVETVVAIGIFTTAVVGLAQLVATSIQANAGARFRTLAALVAQQEIERLRGEAVLEDGTFIEYLDAGGHVVCEGPGLCQDAVFRAAWTIAACATAPSKVVIDLQVTHAHRQVGSVHAIAARARSVR